MMLVAIYKFWQQEPDPLGLAALPHVFSNCGTAYHVHSEHHTDTKCFVADYEGYDITS